MLCVWRAQKDPPSHPASTHVHAHCMLHLCRWFDTYVLEDYARSGNTATETVQLQEGWSFGLHLVSCAVLTVPECVNFAIDGVCLGQLSGQSLIDSKLLFVSCTSRTIWHA